MEDVVPLVDVPQPFQGTLALWMCGVDPREHVGATKFYRHRRELLGYGYDLSKPYAGDPRVIRILLPAGVSAA